MPPLALSLSPSTVLSLPSLTCTVWSEPHSLPVYTQLPLSNIHHLWDLEGFALGRGSCRTPELSVQGVLGYYLRSCPQPLDK
jgi:hypothetical protein